MQKTHIATQRLATALLLLTLAGCSNSGLFKFAKHQFPKTGQKNPVIRVLGIWEPASGMNQGKTCRGFSAQIMFFGQNSDTPAQVDGDVRIYVFDDQGDEEEQAQPIHQFDYPAETWNAFLFNGPLGATYSVFVPYTRPGVHEAKCSLRIRYTPKKGFPAYSDMVSVVLPGNKKFDDDSAQEDTGPLVKLPANAAAKLPTVDQTAPAQHTTSTRLPSPQEIQEQLQAKRPKAVELTDAERRRIMKEATARLKQTEKEKIALVGYEEQAQAEDVADVAPVRPASIARTKAKQSRQAADDNDIFSDDETDRPTRRQPRVPSQRKTSRATADQDQSDDEDF
ncbi:MAG: hypothetical protein JSS02_22930 [Planctomycetes bacterium]|nr:hypothetical protein [Planctomycetota bacterium]